MADPFATVKELSDALQSSPSRDVAQLALTRASGSIRDFCNWTISREVVVDYAVEQPYSSRRLWLPTLWLVSIEELVEATVTLVEGTDFAFERHGRVTRAYGVWNTNVSTITVSYTHGYDVGDYRLEAARDICLAVASRLVGNPYRHTSEQTGTEQWAATVASGDASLSSGEMEQLARMRIEEV